MTCVTMWFLLAVSHTTIPLTSGLECSPEIALNVVVVPWSMKYCEDPFSVVSEAECILECFSKTSCLGANFLTSASNNGTVSVSCGLCLSMDLYGIGVDTTPGNSQFLLPYKYIGNGGLTAPSGRYINILIYMVATPTESFALVLHEPKCDGPIYNDCEVELDLRVSLGTDANSGPAAIRLSKKSLRGPSGPFDDYDNDGFFEIGREFQLLLLALFDDYVIIVDGVEVCRYPVYGTIKPTLQLSTESLDLSGSIVMYQTDET